jgi:hypothetical protein
MNLINENDVIIKFKNAFFLLKIFRCISVFFKKKSTTKYKDFSDLNLESHPN